MLVQIEAGAQDMARSSQVRDIARLKADPTFQVITHPYPGSYLEFASNTQFPPLDNKKVRQALNYAMDRQRFVDTVMQGTSQVQALPWDVTSPAFDAGKNNAYGFDLEKARALLQEAGVSGFEMGMYIIAASNPELLDFSQIYQADLAKLGIKLNIQAMELGTWISQVRDQRTYQGMYGANDVLTNLAPYSMLLASNSWNAAGNISNFQSTPWSELSAAAGTETDPVKQKQLYTQINDVILDESFCMPIASNPTVLLGRSTVRDVTPTFHSSFLFTNTWLDT
jgi:peptide/nickel transport system substrate-binding protein